MPLHPAAPSALLAAVGAESGTRNWRSSQRERERERRRLPPVQWDPLFGCQPDQTRLGTGLIYWSCQTAGSLLPPVVNVSVKCCIIHFSHFHFQILRTLPRPANCSKCIYDGRVREQPSGKFNHRNQKPFSVMTALLSLSLSPIHSLELTKSINKTFAKLHN